MVMIVPAPRNLSRCRNLLVKMILQEFFALCRYFQELSSNRRERTSKGADLDQTANFAKMPATPTDFAKVLKRNEEIVKHYNFSSGWTNVRVLGVGGFGKVFLLRNKRSKTRIACKVVLSQPLERGYSSEEIIHIQMTHANVLRLFCWEQKGNMLCLNLEYCSRGNLQSSLSDLNEEEVESYFKQLLDGVAYIHSRGVVHRDLKPENLLLTKDKVLKISDFGLADLFITDGEEVLVTGMVGTKSYMAPEVLRYKGKRYLGPPVDLWACGIILFNLMTTTKPWSRADPNDENYNMWVEKNEKIYNKDAWKKLNITSMTLLILLLEPNPVKRISGWKSLRQH
ncbi:serine/threonine-protein kinase Chk1-like [Oratosquilla oratoria]|uniref:serine/threonine-protein kinase Chk1-like n=1 Tax=Oratosquilla oratoria TaxID=337810 RepID=UPI003F7579FF